MAFSVLVHDTAHYALNEETLRNPRKNLPVRVRGHAGNAENAEPRRDRRCIFFTDRGGGSSAASNIEEADDASSDRDFRAKERIVLRELKESRLRLRILRAVELLPPQDEALIREATELVNIVATIIRNNSLKRRAIITAGVLGIWFLGFGIWVLM